MKRIGSWRRRTPIGWPVPNWESEGLSPLIVFLSGDEDFYLEETMKLPGYIWIYFLLGAVGSLLQLQPSPALSQTTQASSETASQQAGAERDGQHDFDFEIGTWKIHLSRLQDRLVGSKTWVQFDGTSVTRKVWDGRANLNEFETDSPTGHIEGLTLRVYNTKTHQWSIYWANSTDPALGQPIQPMVGEFKNGRGEFYDQELWKGRAVYVRFIWSKITPNSAHFEQSYSDDGGKTWEVNWITDQTRVEDKADNAH
jgi:hypothetical protein